MKVKQDAFGFKDGKPVSRYTFHVPGGFQLSCINYGCIITEIIAPDREGVLENVVLGFDSIEEYDRHSPYFGAAVGRFAGRIAGGSFELNDRVYQLAQNERTNHLHGGPDGFSHVLWNAEVQENDSHASVIFSYESPDGDQGYPGNISMKIIYTVTADSELVIRYEGVSDQDTLLNVTNHSYFNLSGNLKRDVLKHELIMSSGRFLELNEEFLPTGRIRETEGTAFDFRAGRAIADGTASADPQNALVHHGYDHPFLLNDGRQEIRLTDPESGRVLEVETDEPCVVLYTGNKLAGDHKIRGVQARNYLGMCLETQAAPDFIHHPHFPGAVLKAGETYRTSTKYSFTAN
ncbi:aldose epimerase family protein [Planococcus lenghuensis]|uniref:Aldose 1-epimerase n=1 Tax=Planococcus lenghuensis TaxID=2213202 RepID=A0A1Q2L421_9BACL|nr:galactose mutarotase [Planococcus lenghuensis]